MATTPIGTKPIATIPRGEMPIEINLENLSVDCAEPGLLLVINEINGMYESRVIVIAKE
tara:strand:- start:1658 stop:1834 length:177 start_codon:yes stop_codon:yes gene_type:complete